jgi:Icc-related predicted phosphoesterase
MRILTVSDKIEPVLYGPYIRDRVGRIDLVLACGDLPAYYLEYIVGLLDAPLCYVHGNHDRPLQPDTVRSAAASGPLSWGVDLHARTHAHGGLLLGGLEGCRQYNPGAPYQYTEADVRVQAMQLGSRTLLNRMRFGRHLDVLVTHAPPKGIHDGQDLPHQGFTGYLEFLRRYRPALMVHGHTHVYNRSTVTETMFEGTLVLNSYGYRVVELGRKPAGVGWTVVSSSRYGG